MSDAPVADEGALSWVMGKAVVGWRRAGRTGHVARDWAGKFGLASVPLFERDEIANPDAHTALLGGGPGSFALSETDEPIWRDPRTASWAWSSNLPHHVTVGKRTVAIWRWDPCRAEEFSRTEVERPGETFHKFLNADRVDSTPKFPGHALKIFRRIRSLAAEAGIPDERSVGIFLDFMDMLIESEVRSKASARLMQPAGLRPLHSTEETQNEYRIRIETLCPPL